MTSSSLHSVSRFISCRYSVSIEFHHLHRNSKLSLKPIKCGVPQGSILGPLLYLIYVNDIENSCDSNILSFADDTTIYSSHSDINSLFEMGNAEINNLYTWFCTNKLSLNAGKTKYIIIKPRQRHCDISGRNISINNVSLRLRKSGHVGFCRVGEKIKNFMLGSHTLNQIV